MTRAGLREPWPRTTQSPPFVIEDAPRYRELWVGGSECDDFGWEGCLEESGNYCADESDYAAVAATIHLDQLGYLTLPAGTDMPAGHDGYIVFETDSDYDLAFRVYAYVDISWE